MKILFQKSKTKRGKTLRNCKEKWTVYYKSKCGNRRHRAGEYVSKVLTYVHSHVMNLSTGQFMQTWQAMVVSTEESSPNVTFFTVLRCIESESGSVIENSDSMIFFRSPISAVYCFILFNIQGHLLLLVKKSFSLLLYAL